MHNPEKAGNLRIT